MSQPCQILLGRTCSKRLMMFIVLRSLTYQLSLSIRLCPPMTHLHQGFIGTRRADLLPLQQLNTQTSKVKLIKIAFQDCPKRFIPVFNVSTVSAYVCEHTSYVSIIYICTIYVYMYTKEYPHDFIPLHQFTRIRMRAVRKTNRTADVC